MSQIRVKATIPVAKLIAKRNGGRCLSRGSINATTRLSWICKKKHFWLSSYQSVKAGSWCPECAGVKRLTIKDAQKAAEKKNGKCLSKEIINGKSKLSWECENKHTWTASLQNIKKGRWCKQCSTPGAFRKLEDMQNIAIQRGGQCLSEQYINGHTKLLWQCKYKHEWQAPPNDIFSGRWCKACSVGFMERVCREYFEKIFNEPFPNTRPEWLINPKTKQKLELDGYSKKLKLAFEYQGQHHMRFNSLFHKTKKDLSDRQKLDLTKKRLAQKKGIRVIYIPQIPTFLKLENLLEFLKTEFIKQKIKHPKNILNLKVDLKKAYAPEDSKYNKILKELAKSKKGRFLSPSYLGLHTKVDFECSEKHRWSASPAKVVLANRWCPICAKENKKNDSSKVANEFKFFNLNFKNEYKTLHSRLDVSCNTCNLSWETSLAQIRERLKKRGFVCLRCADVKVQNEPHLLMSYEQARNFVHKLNLKSQKEWNQYVKGNRPDLPKLPYNIPSSPYGPYKNKGFKSLGDWLGTGYVATHERVYRSFSDARLFARSLGLKNQSEWVKYANGQYPDLPKLPEDIPKYPNDSKYTKRGWISWADWLNTKNFKNSFWPFRKARKFIHSLGLRSLDEWSLYRDGKIKKLGMMPDYIPRAPREAYKNSGWKGMPNWLGYS